MQPLKIAVIGAGLIGKTHIKLIRANPECHLAAIVDPTPNAQMFAETLHTPWYASLDELLGTDKVDGVIIASPNALHVEQALVCLKTNTPAIIEKPVAHDIESGLQLLNISESSETPLIVGHHRMHSPIMKQAKQVIRSGALGDLVALHGSALFYKPDDYFEAGPWRTQSGGGPILINMIHEVGNLRYLCGEITSVQAIASHSRRQFEVEDTAAILFNFANGMLGTFVLSDTAASAQSWEQTAQENKRYASYEDEDCYHIAGTQGSLSVPTMRLKQYPNTQDRSWWKPFECSSVPLERQDPLQAQLQHFCQVIRGEEVPLVSVHDGLQNLRITEAIAIAANSGQRITIQS